MIEALHGKFTDWTYGAGWDFDGPEATSMTCDPTTAPKLGNWFFQRENGIVEPLSELASASLRVLADSDPNPDVVLYGSREVVYEDSNDMQNSVFQVTVDSVASLDNSESYNGHINRNIRLAMGMIDLAKPYFQIDKILAIQEEDKDLL